MGDLGLHLHPRWAAYQTAVRGFSCFKALQSLRDASGHCDHVTYSAAPRSEQAPELPSKHTLSQNSSWGVICAVSLFRRVWYVLHRGFAEGS